MSNIESFLRHYLVFEEVESKFRVFFDDSSNLLDKKTGRNSASYSHIDWNWRKGIAITQCLYILSLSLLLPKVRCRVYVFKVVRTQSAWTRPRTCDVVADKILYRTPPQTISFLKSVQIELKAATPVELGAAKDERRMFPSTSGTDLSHSGKE